MCKKNRYLLVLLFTVSFVHSNEKYNHNKKAAVCFLAYDSFHCLMKFQVQSIPSVGARRTVEEPLTVFVPPELLPFLLPPTSTPKSL